MSNIPKLRETGSSTVRKRDRRERATNKGYGTYILATVVQKPHFQVASICTWIWH